MSVYSVLPVALLGLPLLCVLAVVGWVSWGAVAGVALALGVLVLVRALVPVLVRKGRAPRPDGG
ncbi:hypothetical protein ACFVYD_01075 [Streptomyces sp. NPDC058301]|uniref:hypothetical protein n=1 Tax=Streptomyces sp. NPDC058301 TaxID=3346436 RepID=UPI0036E1B070